LKTKKPKSSIFTQFLLKSNSYDKIYVNVIGVQLFGTTTKKPRVNVVIFLRFWSTTNNRHGFKIKLSLPKVLLAATNRSHPFLRHFGHFK